MKFNIYKPDKSWIVIEVLKIMLILVVIGLLFYNSMVGCLVAIPIGIIMWRQDISLYERNCKRRMRGEFKDVIIKVSGNLNAGYSLENAFVQATHDTEKEGSGYMLKQLKKIVAGLSYNRRIEDMLMDIGEESQVEEISEFARLIVIAKSYGGNIVHLIRQTAGNLAMRQSVELEIRTMVAAKKLEGNIMVLMPFIIIVFMRMTNGSYMDVLYNTLIGRLVMTICLVLVIASWIVINKIMRIGE